jgi:RHS repeat-associated protein
LTAGDATYQYDVDGYLTTKTVGTQAPFEVTSYAYSSRGELLSVTLPDGRLIEYVHDPLGRRIAKKVNGTVTEKYLWQGLTRLLAVYDGADSLVMRFEYADGRMPVAMEQGGATYYLTYDQVGSLSVVADASGNVVKRIDYDSFGNIINDTNAAFEIPFGFAGGLHDRDTGLVRFGFRDYDPDIGRWTAKDPVFFEGGDVDLYGYCLSDPVDWIDPDGFQAAAIAGGSAPPWLGGPANNPELQGAYEKGGTALSKLFNPVPLLETLSYYLLEGGIGEWFYNITHGDLAAPCLKADQVGPYDVGKPERGHPGSKPHIHWGPRGKGRENAVNQDGSVRHGKKPPGRVRKHIRKKYGWRV